MVREKGVKTGGNDPERGADSRLSLAEEAAKRRQLEIEARRPKIPEEDFAREFSIMLRTGASFNPKSAKIKGNEDLFYVGEDGKLRVPDFMVSFLRNEYDQKWGGGNTTYRDLDYFVSRGPLHRASFEGVFLPDAKPDPHNKHIEFTTPERMRDEYRRVQIERMTPEEAERARQEDRIAADTVATFRILSELITDEKFEEKIGTFLSHLLTLRHKGYGAPDLRKFIRDSEERIRKTIASEKDDNARNLVLARLDKLASVLPPEAAQD